ncbi:helix-turn-helix transcriptional regulator [Nesterenkonia alba]|uniref:helix-turn-helix transcriptional regulator n=1 Tax=Nesterenkonia alba TaxID=515814 RepID=UPI00048D97F3|nr:LuxR family transcriptional regulator [Nesterenkonia alba]
MRPVVGREKEISQIRRAADLSTPGRPHFLYVEGFAGVGKTTTVLKALHPYTDRREYSVVLDRDAGASPGAALRRFLQRPGEDLSSYSTDDLVALAVERASQRITEPSILTVANAQRLDAESAQAVIRVLSLIRGLPLLVVFTGRPSPCPAVTQLAGFARNSPQAAYIGLDPLTPVETRELLGHYINTPISTEVAETVHEHTAGYPLLIHEVGEHLASVPIGRRRLADSLRILGSGRASQRIHRALDEVLAPASPTTIRALELLAASAECSSESLSKREIDEALGEATVEFSDLLETGLAVWDETRFGYTTRNHVIARALLDRTSSQNYAEVHWRLSEVLDEVRSLRHQVAAVRASAQSEDIDCLITRLREQAEKALMRGDLEDAFQWFLRVAQLRPDAKALEDILHIGVPLGHMDCLPPFGAALRRLEPGPLRQGGLALLALEENDLSEAIAAVERQPRFDVTAQGALVFAHAVANLSAQLGIQGIIGRAAQVKMHTLMMLSAMEENLRHRIASYSEDDPLPVEGLEWERAHAAGLRAVIELWQVLEHRDPQMMRRAVDDISLELKRLEQVPITEMFQVGLRAGRGTRFRQISDPVRAYEDLTKATETAQGSQFLIYAQAQLAHVLFTAGFWQEAEDVAAYAAGRALAAREDASALIAYATWAMVPLCRGDYEQVQPLIEELEEARSSTGPILAASLEYLHAWRAVIEADHELTVQHLLKMRDTSGGWWNIGIDPMLLLVRAAHYAGWGSAIQPLYRAVTSGDCPARDEFQYAVTSYMEAFQAWQAYDPVKAMGHFLRVYEWLDAQPPLRSGMQTSESGGYRMHKAFNFLDMAALLIAFPEELRRHRATAIEGLEWTASVFRSVNAQGLMQFALEELSALRPRLHMGHAPSAHAPNGNSQGQSAEPQHPTPAFPPPRNEDDDAGPSPMEKLSARERQVALLVADGNTNKEIAEELNVSVRTVDFHVSNALAKLGLRSRREIRRKLRGLDNGTHVEASLPAR